MALVGFAAVSSIGDDARSGSGGSTDSTDFDAVARSGGSVDFGAAARSGSGGSTDSTDFDAAARSGSGSGGRIGSGNAAGSCAETTDRVDSVAAFSKAEAIFVPAGLDLIGAWLGGLAAGGGDLPCDALAVRLAAGLDLIGAWLGGLAAGGDDLPCAAPVARFAAGSLTAARYRSGILLPPFCGTMFAAVAASTCRAFNASLRFNNRRTVALLTMPPLLYDCSSLRSRESAD